MKFFTQAKETKPIAHQPIPKEFRAAKSTESLASQPDIAHAITHIQSLATLPSHYFLLLYAQPLFNFLQLTQPCSREVVKERLSKVVHGLTLRRAFILPKGVNPDSIREKKDRWTYAVFIALLMYDLASIVKPMVYRNRDKDSRNTGAWSPLINRLPDLPYIYKAIDNTPYTQIATPLLLHRLFNEACLNWLSEDSQAFNETLESMVSPQPTSSIGPLVLSSYQLKKKKADSIDETTCCNSTKKDEPTNDDNPNQQTSSDNLTPTKPVTSDNSKPVKVSARDIGQNFSDWLKASFRERNPGLQQQGLIHTLPQGIALITPAIFQHYAADEDLDWKQVQKGFLKLRFHTPNLQTGESVYKITLSNRKKVNAIIIPEL